MPISKSKSVGSIEKKRARDRRAQQNLRTKQLSRIQSLETQLAELGEQCKSHQNEMQNLRAENETLRCVQYRIRQMVCLCEPGTNELSADGGLHGSTSTRPCLTTSPTATGQYLYHESTVPIEEVVQTSGSMPPSNIRTARSKLASGFNISPWNNIPLHSAQGPFIFSDFNSCLSRPDLVQASSDEPSPLELLYGSSQNFLADIIHKATRFWPVCDAERLAGGFLTYHLVKWLTRPSQINFARLLEFQKPLNEQLELPHPCGIDFILWPALRSNLAKNYHMYDLKNVLAAFSCSLKLRWPWGEGFLEPDANNRLRMRKAFYNTFTRIEGWGLTDEFQTQYPELMVGMDIDAVRYRPF